MQKNKADKVPAHEIQNHPSTIKPIIPNSDRVKRLLVALSIGAKMRHDLDGIIGTDNAPEYVSQARAMNWHIKTERVPMTDRDGKKISVGRYHLSLEHRALAAKLLNNGG
jgi:hypothetical protein